GDAADGIHDVKAELFDDAIILIEHFALEEPEAFHGIRAPAEVHARLIELEFHASCHQPIERHVDRHAEIQREIRANGEPVQLAYPLAIDAAGHVARERRVRVTI